MARRSDPLSLWGGGAAALVALACLGPLLAVLVQARGGPSLTRPDLAAIWFTLWQAVASAAISCLLAVPVARALARRRFPGRGALVSLLGAPFLLPTIVATLGLLTVLGRAGWVNQGLGALGLPPLGIYGAQGVVLAHVFFNLPLATRLILHGWLAIPAERLRLSATLNLRGWTAFRTTEAPMLARVLPGAFLAVFLICSTSFSVALILGGGPKATTVELAIYQALRFDFDPGRAALLSLIQVAICISAGVLAWRATGRSAMTGGLDGAVDRWDGRVWLDTLWITLAALFLIVPLAAIVAKGIAGLPALPMEAYRAALRSVLVALGSTAVAVTLALGVALARTRAQAVAGVLPLAVSPLVLGTGLFLLIRPFAAPPDLALPVTALVNALLVLPFGLGALAPAVAEVQTIWGRQAELLGLRGWSRLRIVLLPRLRRPLGFTAGICAALSMGDLGVITLFAGRGQETLPLYMFGLMGSYRMEEAASAGVLLVALSFALFWMFDRGGRTHATV